MALGACIIEKHLTLDRKYGGVDSALSLEPHELKELVKTSHNVYPSTGQVIFGATATEQAILGLRRSLYVVAPVAKGARLTVSNIRSIRPSNGMVPKFLNQVLGRQATRGLAFGEPLDASMIEGTLQGL